MTERTLIPMQELTQRHQGLLDNPPMYYETDEVPEYIEDSVKTGLHGQLYVAGNDRKILDGIRAAVLKYRSDDFLTLPEDGKLVLPHKYRAMIDYPLVSSSQIASGLKSNLPLCQLYIALTQPRHGKNEASIQYVRMNSKFETITEEVKKPSPHARGLLAAVGMQQQIGIVALRNVKYFLSDIQEPGERKPKKVDPSKIRQDVNVLHDVQKLHREWDEVIMNITGQLPEDDQKYARLIASDILTLNFTNRGSKTGYDLMKTYAKIFLQGNFQEAEDVRVFFNAYFPGLYSREKASLIAQPGTETIGSIKGFKRQQKAGAIMVSHEDIPQSMRCLLRDKTMGEDTDLEENTPKSI